MQNNQGGARAWPFNRRHRLAAPGRRISGQDYHTGRHHPSAECCATLGKRERGESRSRGLDVVDRWIALTRWLSGSRSSVQTRKSLEVSPQLSGHWTYGCLRTRTVGDRTRARHGDQEERGIAGAWSEDGGGLQRLTGCNPTSGTTGAGLCAATGEADQHKIVESPRALHCNRDPLGPRTLRHPRK